MAVATVVEHPDPSWVGRRLVVRPDGRRRPPAVDRLGRAPTPRSPTTRWACSRPGHNQTLTYGPDGERRGEGMRVFVWSFAPPPRMLVFGAIDFAAAVARMGGFLGYQVTVCDARPVFATSSRFPVGRRGGREVAAQVPPRRGRGRPHRPAHRALRADPRPEVRRAAARGGAAAAEVAYVGAMGSRRTHDDRIARLNEAGLTDEELARLSSPGRASTSAPARPRRPRSASPPRSSRCAGAATGERLARARRPHPPLTPAAGCLTVRTGRAILTAVTLVSDRQNGNDRHDRTHDARSGPQEMSMTRISVTVDGASYSDDVEPRMLLVHYLRERLGKTGTVVGCDTSNCGACTVHLGGRSVKSCNVLAVQADGAGGHHGRGARPGRRAAPHAGGLPRVPRPPVRLLHARA